MFGRRKKKEDHREKTAPAEPASPFSDDEAEARKALWRLTALPREEFDATYGDLLSRCWRSIAEAPGAEWAALRERSLKCVIAALKVRQAYVLPRFAAAEDSSRLTEVMSFALAACVLAERFAELLGRTVAPGWSPLHGDVPAAATLSEMAVPRSFGALLLTRLIGHAGHEWLAQEREALWAAAAYFGEGRSELREIGHDAAARIGLPFVAPAPAHETGGGNDTSAEREADGDASAAEAGAEPESAATPGDKPVGESATAPEPAPSDIGDGRVGWQWFNRVRAGLRDGSVVPNAEGGWLHNIDGAAFVVDPDCFEALAAAESLPPKSIRNRVLKLGRHRTRRSLAGRADAFAAELADGRRVTGMLFDGELFWDKNAPPASTSVLR